MKNQYFGDVKDYFKYGLLRCCVEAGFEVGVCWMLTPDDRGSDGRKTRYLAAPNAWRHHDPPLFDYLLRAVVLENIRDTRQVRELVPRSAFWSNLVPELAASRRVWLADCFRALERSSLWFFDPDNGIEVPSAARTQRRSTKHIYWDEMEAAWASGRSILVFQHFARENHVSHSQRLVAEMTRRLFGATVVPLQTGEVLYLYAGRPEHSAQTAAAIRLLNQRWGTRLVRATPSPGMVRTKDRLPGAAQPSIWRGLGYLARSFRRWLVRRK